MGTISPVTRGANGNTTLYPGTLKGEGDHEKEDTESEYECVTLSSDWSRCSLSEPPGSCHWNGGIPTEGSGGKRGRGWRKCVWCGEEELGKEECHQARMGHSSWLWRRVLCRCQLLGQSGHKAKVWAAAVPSARRKLGLIAEVPG